MPSTVRQGPRLGPSIGARLSTSTLQADVLPDVQEVDALDHLSSPLVRTLPTGPSVLGIRTGVPTPVVVRASAGRGLRSPRTSTWVRPS